MSCFSRLNEDSWFRCYGVDTNRNWAFHWNEGGASGDTCSETYRGTSRSPHSFDCDCDHSALAHAHNIHLGGVAGPKSFSEPEVTALADYISAQGNVKGYADIHSYSQLWMSVRAPAPHTTSSSSVNFLCPPILCFRSNGAGPRRRCPRTSPPRTTCPSVCLPVTLVSPTPTKLTPSVASLSLFIVAVAAIKATHGKVYGYGPSAKVIYVASGGADDWTYGARNVTWSYSVELRDTGTSTLGSGGLVSGLISRTRLFCCFWVFRSLRLRVAGQRDRAHWAGDLRCGARDGQLHPHPHLVALPDPTLLYEQKRLVTVCHLVQSTPSPPHKPGRSENFCRHLTLS